MEYSKHHIGFIQIGNHDDKSREEKELLRLVEEKQLIVEYWKVKGTLYNKMLLVKIVNKNGDVLIDYLFKGDSHAKNERRAIKMTLKIISNATIP